jgi:glycine betaine/choline ABC-type transport system substrate-binding protein
MKPTRRAILRSGAIAGTTGIAGLAGCSGRGGESADSGGGSTDSGPQQVSVRAGSKRFAEQEFFGALSMQSIRANAENAEVVDETGLGGTAQVWRAMTNDEIEHYWTYSNTQWNQIHGQDSVIADRDEMIQTLNDYYAENLPDLTLLEPSQANAVWTIVVRPDWADKHGIETISDFAEYVRNESTDFTFVTYTEFAEREDGLPNMLKEYEIPQDRWNQINVRKVGYGGLNYQILNSGDAVATVGWRTQPQIYQYGLNTLDDDRGYFSTSVIMPVIQKEIVDNNPTVRSAINAVSAALTTEAVQENVLKISNTDANAADAAEKFLKANDVI